MSKYNPKNERIKKAYFRHLQEACGRAESTLNGVRKAIHRFESYAGMKDLAAFNKEQAIGFKKHLSKGTVGRSGERLGKATVLSCLNALKDFLRWLICQPGYKSRIKVTDIDYLNLTDKEVSIARAGKFRDFPTLEQIRQVILTMPTDTEIQRRDRALIAFTILTGARDSAIASLSLQHFDELKKLVRQEPDKVKTKFSKRIDTYFFPVGDDIEKVFLSWAHELKNDKLYGNDAPLFPRTRLGHDENMSFTASGLEPIHWKTTAPIRKIFREAFEAAGVPYFNPHLFRNTLTDFGQRCCLTPEELKAWSQNLGHESPLTTFTSYGKIDPHRQGELIRNVAQKECQQSKMDEILHYIRRKEGPPNDE
jgi:integrase/recombinase XerD